MQILGCIFEGTTASLRRLEGEVKGKNSQIFCGRPLANAYVGPQHTLMNLSAGNSTTTIWLLLNIPTLLLQDHSTNQCFINGFAKDFITFLNQIATNNRNNIICNRLITWWPTTTCTGRCHGVFGVLRQYRQL